MTCRSRILLLCCCAIMMAGLSGCSLFGGVDTDYSVEAGQGGDTETASYLNDILKDRVEIQTETLSKEKDEEQRARQEEYMEQTIRNDLLKGLHAKGYYSAKVNYRDGQKPFSGRYDIDYGKTYILSSIEVSPPSFAKHLNPEWLKTGDVLDARRVLDAQSNINKSIQKGKCYFGLEVGHAVRLNPNKNTGALVFNVKAGEEGQFGDVRFTGNTSVRSSFLYKLIPWKRGECYRQEKVEAFKTSLMQSGLFTRADMVLPETPDKNSNVGITVDLRERAHRSVNAGLTYYSDEGPGTVLGWEHRNLLGASEKLTTKLGLSTLKQSLDVEFTKPYFLRKDQSFTLNTGITRQQTDAFDEMGVTAGGKITRSFGKHLSGSTGIDLTLTRIDDATIDDARTHGLISLPQTLTFDTRDNSLNPVKGVLLTASAEPFFDTLGEADPFMKAQVTGSTYINLNKASSVVLAAKAGYGSIWGASIENVPATERFFAGGGGSVRGYGFQEVGPQRDGDPTGGLSLVNFSVELRAKPWEKIGGAIFIDGANVSEDSVPDTSNIALGVGAGLRYFTDFGPIRFDVATPLTETEELVDQRYQFYISIGQAF